ncbi:SIS domain-containing protein [Kineococcus gynurae]|uniref:SIS domain-containing protein n=1 Tax=Kineococcus gynurae TaxID=452979 RepID=A0ABV5LR98_9ACTN
MTALDEALLADADALARADTSQMLRGLASAGAQVRESVGLTEEAGLARFAADGRPRALLIASLGGSSVVTDVLTSLAGGTCPVPVVARRGGRLPSWIGALDVVVAVSMSGRAPGPLELAAEASRRGARVLTVGAARSPLAEIGGRVGNLHVSPAEGVRAAGGSRSSRVALWSLLTPVLMAADALDLVKVPTGVLAEVADRLDAVAETCKPATEPFVNPAKTLALELGGTAPVVLADSDLTAAAARRCASMLARTARVPAVGGALPDDASEIVATFGGPFAARPDDVFADPFLDDPVGTRLQLLVLRDAPVALTDAERHLVHAVTTTAADAGVRVSEVVAEPGPALVRLAELIARTDFAATYLALAAGIDPATSPHVADLRDRLD